MNPLKTFVGTLSTSDNKIKHKATASIYDIEINSLAGKPIKLSEFKGKKILFVNVASKCGFTPQYRALQELSDSYKDKLVVIGNPCNQFGGQEPGNADEIQEFCKVNYGVTFLITEKIDVKGSNQHPLYKWLTSKRLNGKQNSTVKWNFQKYLIDEHGEFIDYFYSITKPTNSRITKHLK
ncbi:glutathione peroxidase [Winogradskyella sp. J14-2]|uniref:glutathione peroxidase n=1 Tax=Winogradskyella sp. J14-2 TaxID=1936080 RepID=UPI000972BDD0|nr:glutathione peroxidase [Winogradskyella sp. J14-2]APY09438.1 glutathione peroxidase [Winogradskyella sp. J14-2]